MILAPLYSQPLTHYSVSYFFSFHTLFASSSNVFDISFGQNNHRDRSLGTSSRLASYRTRSRLDWSLRTTNNSYRTTTNLTSNGTLWFKSKVVHIPICWVSYFILSRHCSCLSSSQDLTVPSMLAPNYSQPQLIQQQLKRSFLLVPSAVSLLLLLL